MATKVDFKWNLLQLGRLINLTASERMEVVCIGIVNDIKNSFGAATAMPKFGETGMRKRKGATKRWRQRNASKPGEPPHVVTGTLRSSIGFAISDGRFGGGKGIATPRSGPESVVGVVGSNLQIPPYPYYLEVGTSRMKARPFLRPALDRAQPYIKRIFATLQGTK